jgi:hypothetical protein
MIRVCITFGCRSSALRRTQGVCTSRGQNGDKALLPVCASLVTDSVGDLEGSASTAAAKSVIEGITGSQFIIALDALRLLI